MTSSTSLQFSQEVQAGLKCNCTEALVQKEEFQTRNETLERQGSLFRQACDAYESIHSR